MNTPVPSITASINYDVESTKNAINEIREFVKPTDGNGFYSADANEIFGIYDFNTHHFDSISGNVFGSMKVSVSKNTEGSTNISVTTISNTSGPLDNARCSQIQSHFLKLLSTKLEGGNIGEITQKRVEQTPNHTSEIALLMVAIVIIVIIIFAVSS